MGDARIAGGRLKLNGTDAFLLIDRFRAEPQAMFYQPRSRATGRMWDTWLYFRQGTYYLYYLANCGKSWDNISLATSNDGVHWLEHGVVLRKRPDAVWMGTGSTWKSPRGTTSSTSTSLNGVTTNRRSSSRSPQTWSIGSVSTIGTNSSPTRGGTT